MELALAGLATDARSAFGTVVASSEDSAVGWLLVGLALHLANQVARGRGWCAVVNASAGDHPVRHRQVVPAWIAGAGVAGIVTARLGDLLRVVLLGHAAPRLGRAHVAGTLAAEAVGELAVGFVVTAAAVLLGIGGGFGRGGILVAAALGLAAMVLAVRRRRGQRPGASDARGPRRLRAPRFLAGLRDGLAALASPRAYARRVLPWQLASRGLRLVSLACFLHAFGLSVSVQAVLLVVLAQSAGNAIPFSPAAMAAGAATLAATFGPLTHSSAPAGHVVAFYVGTIGLLSVTGVVCAAAITAAAAISWRRTQPNPSLMLPAGAPSQR